MPELNRSRFADAQMTPKQERARWDDIAADHRTVRVRGTKNDHREADVPIATLEQAWLLAYATRR